MNETIVSEKVRFNTKNTRSGKKIGCITLNQEKSLNALNLEMASAILNQLNDWRNDENIICVFIEGAGDRALCAGGDIKAMYYDMQADSEDAGKETETFFEKEYTMDYTLQTYPIPIIAWGHGVVMGGGLGIFMGADVRIVSEKSRLAMPEITIGLFPDVGASFFLNQIPQPFGRFMALTGAIANATDALELGLANALLSHEKKSDFLDALLALDFSREKSQDVEHIQALIKNLDADSSNTLPSSELTEVKPLLDPIFCIEDSNQLIAAFLSLETNNTWINKAQANLKNGSPLSARIIDEQFKRAKNYSLEQVFESEMILASTIIRFTELSEGVRALLIDKDNQPKWHYKNHFDVPNDVIESFFKAPWETNPLQLNHEQ